MSQVIRIDIWHLIYYKVSLNKNLVLNSVKVPEINKRSDKKRSRNGDVEDQKIP